MTDSEPTEPATSAPPPLRVWPAVILLAIGLGLRFGIGVVQDVPQSIGMLSVLGPALCSLAVALWWLTFSRSAWKERIFGFLGLITAATLAILASDKTMIGPPTVMLTVPMGLAAFAIGTILVSRSTWGKRVVIPVLLSAIGFSYSALWRNEGMWGDNRFELQSRFTPSVEQQLVAAKANVPRGEGLNSVSPTEEIEAWLAEPDWPDFRGADRRAITAGANLATNWDEAVPELIWKTPVGPGWSSFAVAGDLLFTQEQRGEVETVVCYDATTGDEIWSEGVESRFNDTLGGPGPRATPTIAHGDLFVMGASGQLQRMNAKSGETIWLTDLREMARRDPPEWGFSSSPLVVGDVVVVHAGGDEDRGTLGLDVDSGQLAWSAPAGDHSYSSPQLVQLGGQTFIAMLTNAGIDLLAPQSGDVVLSYDWNVQGYRALQPAIVGNERLLLPTGSGMGTRAIDLSFDESSGWRAEEQWTSVKLKPDFNDLVVHEGYGYGFDGTIFTCIDLTTGDRMWKGGRYGKGQVLLLRDINRLLVVTEKGKVVLLKTSPDAHQEDGDFQAVEGKTWNHPVVVGDRLYLRNSKEAACYRLPVATVEHS